MTTTEPKRTPRNPLLDDLCQRFAVFRDARPLALGIHKAVIIALPETGIAPLRLALRIHTASTRYLKALSVGGARFDLEGNPVGEVTEEQRQVAAKSLRERFAQRVDRKAQQDAARKRAEDERRRQERLGALVEKFRKP